MQEYISKEWQAPNIAFQWPLTDQQVEKVLRKTTPQYDRNHDIRTKMDSRWLEANGSWKCDLSLGGKLFDFDENEHVMKITMLLALSTDDNDDFRCSEHASLWGGGIIVVCWGNIENIDTESIIYAHWGVKQEGTSQGDCLGPKSEVEGFYVESMMNKYLIPILFTSDKQGRRNVRLEGGPGAQSRL